MDGDATVLEDIGRRHPEPTVEHRVGVVVDREIGSAERHAHEQSTAAGIRIDLGTEFGVGSRIGLYAHGACRHRRIGTERDLLPLQDAVEAARGGEHEQDVGRLHAHLESDTAAPHRHHHWRAPCAVGITDVKHALPIVDTEDESALDHIGEDRHALGLLQHRRRERLAWIREELVERLAGAHDGLDFLLAGDGLGHGRPHIPAHQQTTDQDTEHEPGRHRSHGASLRGEETTGLLDYPASAFPVDGSFCERQPSRARAS